MIKKSYYIEIIDVIKNIINLIIQETYVIIKFGHYDRAVPSFLKVWGLLGDRGGNLIKFVEILNFRK